MTADTFFNIVNNWEEVGADNLVYHGSLQHVCANNICPATCKPLEITSTIKYPVFMYV